MIDWVDVTTRIVCALRGQVTGEAHQWRPYEMVRGATDDTMRFARREFCQTCSSNRLLYDDGDELVVPRVEVVDLSPRWMEGLYRARWGELPRRRVTIGGAFPMEWQW